jgi:glucosamine-6-phosphate deaminase
MIKDIKSFNLNNLQVKIYNEEADAGQAAAVFVAESIQKAIQKNGKANLILATGASQFAFLDALKQKEIDWQKITVFHLDEYKNLSDQHPASFRKYLKERILDIVKPGKVYLINGDAPDLQNEIEQYEKLLKEHPIDVACIGIGENGHIAFNDPPVADFNDPKWVKVVELDEACRRQQLGEGWFPTFDDVPKEAVTLTVTAIMNCKTISCMVPGERKAQAIKDTLEGEITTACPASILRTHPDTVLFMDLPAASKLSNRR